MDRTRFHMFVVATIIVLMVGFYILLSPPFKDLRTTIGLPADQPGARYNETVDAADIISGVQFNYTTGELSYTQEGWKAAEQYLGRIAFVYHSVFITLIYATVIILANIYLEGKEKELVLNGSLLATLMVVVSALMYSYVDRNFFWHGVFITGLALFWFIGAYMFLKFKPKDLLDWNIWIAGLLLLIGAAWGAWLGSAFMHYRESFLEALIISRFNPDLSEENVFWRGLTSHEHAMIAIALALVFFTAIKITGVDEEKKLLKIFSVRLLFIFGIIGQLFMALASYSVTFFGKIAHLVITPAALILIGSTLFLSFVVKKGGIIRWALIIGNIAIWIGVAAEGAITAINLRKALFLLPIPFRDPSYDWAELAYNIGHWHILLFSWGVILLFIYMVYPEDFTEQYKYIYYLMWLTLIGYFVAVIGINLYMLANPPGAYIPNPYNNVWLSTIVEPALGLVSIGVGVSYLLYLYRFGWDSLKHIVESIRNYFKFQ